MFCRFASRHCQNTGVNNACFGLIVTIVKQSYNRNNNISHKEMITTMEAKSSLTSKDNKNDIKTNNATFDGDKTRLNTHLTDHEDSLN